MTQADGRPDPAAVHDLPDLASHLDALRRRAAHGSGKARISLAALATAARIPRSTVHLYVTGRTLPPADVLDRVVIALGATAAEQRAWAEAWYRVGSAPDAGGGGVPVSAGPPAPAGGPLAPWRGPVPRQLPPVTRLFGRDHLLGQVVAALAPRAATTDAEVPTVVLLHGLAGQGKTALAVRAAHAVGSGYVDGQLHADLGGGGATPRPPADVLGAFLRALGVDTGSARAGLDELAAAFRSATAGRRLLVVLDNAQDETQVLPLLPGTAGCTTLVTSRSALPDLDVDLRVRVTPLDAAAGLALLAAACGDDRVAAEPVAAAAVVRRCAGLPLAVRIVGGRLAGQPTLGVAELAERLADDGHRLDHLASASRGVQAELARTVAHLGPAARRALRGAAVFGPLDFGAWLLAPLAGVDLAGATAAADELAVAGLLEPASVPPRPARHRLHDLVRAVAAPQAERAGVARATSWVLALTALADAASTGRAADTELPAGPAGDPHAAALLDAVRSDPWAWAQQETALAAAALDLAVRSGDGAVAAALLSHLAPLLTRAQDVDAVFQAAARCRAIADTDALAVVRCDLVLGQALLQRSEYPRATAVLAVVAASSSDAPAYVQADAWRNLGFGRTFCDDRAGAVVAHHAALARSDGTGDLWGCAEAHRGLSVAHRETDPRAAVRHGELARELADATPDHRARSIARFGLARLALREGDTRRALLYADQAWQIARDHADAVAEGWCSVLCADAYRAAEILPSARAFAVRAGEIGGATQRPDLQAAAHAALARVEGRRGDGAAADRWSRSAGSLHRRFDSPRERRELRDGTHDHAVPAEDAGTA